MDYMHQIVMFLGDKAKIDPLLLLVIYQLNKLDKRVFRLEILERFMEKPKHA